MLPLDHIALRDLSFVHIAAQQFNWMRISVSAALFHDAYNRWNSPQTYGISSWSSIRDNHWELDECIAHGDISDVYIGRRARWPTQLVIIKLLRELRDLDLI